MQTDVAVVLRMDERDVRTEKLLFSLAPRYRCVIIGWNRFPEDWRPADRGWEREILHRPTGEGPSNVRHAFRLSRHIRAALDKHRPKVVIAVNEEVAFLLRRYRSRLFQRLILDIHDELDLRVRTANPLLRRALSLIAGTARSAADCIFSTSEARKARLEAAHQAKTVVVPNYPIDHGGPLWRRLPAGECKLFVGGALARPRGLEPALAASRRVGIPILAAGPLRDGYAREFVRDPAVQYHGRVSPEDAMRLLAECDASLVMYEPGPEINTLASPNKLYDALCAGRPIIVNREAALSAWVREQRLGFCVPYGDTGELANVLARIKQGRSELGGFAERARGIFSQGYSWASVAPRILDAVDRAMKSSN